MCVVMLTGVCDVLFANIHVSHVTCCCRLLILAHLACDRICEFMPEAPAPGEGLSTLIRRSRTILRICQKFVGETGDVVDEHLLSASMFMTYQSC